MSRSRQRRRPTPLRVWTPISRYHRREPDRSVSLRAESNVLTLPPGLTLNANAADGKVACTDAEAIRQPRRSPMSRRREDRDPDAVELGAARPASRLRLYRRAETRGEVPDLPRRRRLQRAHKAAGGRDPRSADRPADDPLDELPQAPFSDLNIHLFGSERGALATSTHCDTYVVSSEFTPGRLPLPAELRQSFSLTPDRPAARVPPRSAVRADLRGGGHRQDGRCPLPLLGEPDEDRRRPDPQDLIVATPPGSPRRSPASPTARRQPSPRPQIRPQRRDRAQNPTARPPLRSAQSLPASAPEITRFTLRARSTSRDHTKECRSAW